MSKLGLNILLQKDTASTSAQVDMEAMLFEAIEVHAACENLALAGVELDQVSADVEQMGVVLSALKSGGIDSTMEGLFGPLLSANFEGYAAQDADLAAQQIEACEESFKDTVVTFIKNVIAKIKAFFSRLFTSSKAQSESITKLLEEKGPFDEAKTLTASISGYSKEAFNSAVTATKYLQDELAKFTGDDDVESTKTTIAGLTDFGAFGKAGIEVNEDKTKMSFSKESKKSTKSLADHKFSFAELTANATKISEIVAQKKDVQKALKDAEGKLTKIKGDDEASKKQAEALKLTVSFLSSAGSVYGKLCTDLGVQQVAMLKARKVEGKKKDEKKEDDT